VTALQGFLLAAGVTIAVYAAFVGWWPFTGRRQDARAFAGSFRTASCSLAA